MTIVDGGRVVLRIDSGAEHNGSVSRALADELIDRIVGPRDVLVRRAAAEGLPVVTAAWVAASFDGGDHDELTVSDELVDELLAADELVLVAPIYNFGVPAAMKAWIDQVVRAGRTFRFTERGPVGLVTARRAWIVTASRGTAVGGESDFNTTYLRAILEFVGVADVRVVAAAQLAILGDSAIERAIAEMDAMVTADRS